MADKNYLIRFHMRQGGYGWTYQFYWFGSSARAAVEAGEALIEPIIGIGFGWTILGRISASSAEVGDRDNFSRTYNRSNVGVNSNPADPDVVKTSARVRLFAAGNEVRDLYLRGLADDDIKRTDAGRDVPSSFLLEPLDVLLDAIVQAQCRIQAIVPAEVDGAAVTDWKRVEKIEPDVVAGPFLSVFTVTGHGLTPGVDRVIFKMPFRKNPELLAYRGAHQVILGDANTFKVPAQYRFRDDVIYTKGIYARALEYTYPLITGGEFSAFTTRDTGPARLSRGREPGISFR